MQRDISIRLINISERHLRVGHGAISVPEDFQGTQTDLNILSHQCTKRRYYKRVNFACLKIVRE